MDLSQAKRLIVYGGSFDPPHRAHVRLPRSVRKRLGAEALIYVPAGAPPHKPTGGLTAAHHRVAMLTLALESEPSAGTVCEAG